MRNCHDLHAKTTNQQQYHLILHGKRYDTFYKYPIWLHSPHFSFSLLPSHLIFSSRDKNGATKNYDILPVEKSSSLVSQNNDKGTQCHTHPSHHPSMLPMPPLPQPNKEPLGPMTKLATATTQAHFKHLKAHCLTKQETVLATNACMGKTALAWSRMHVVGSSQQKDQEEDNIILAWEAMGMHCLLKREDDDKFGDFC